jgi:ACT domain-containing protein
MVDLAHSATPLDVLKGELVELGEVLNVSISIMHERVFSAMHRI